ncbi:MAG: hypothetical protein ACKVXR_14735 [Planctomycetota bacterium]
MKAAAQEGRASATPPRRGFSLVRPYSTLAGAKAALDNGGRFYHLIARGGDGKLAKSELSKAAGVIFDEAGSFVFFDMALASLRSEEKAQVVAMLGPKVARRYKDRGPRHVTVKDASGVLAGKSVIIEGVPRFERSITILQTGMIMVGKVMVPVTNQLPHDLYTLRNSGSASGPSLGLIVWNHKSRLLEVPTRFGGRMMLERVKTATGEEKQKLLVPAFHTPLD